MYSEHGSRPALQTRLAPSISCALSARNSSALDFSSSAPVLHYDVPISEDDGRKKLREMFEKNRDVSDIRAIDLLVLKVSDLW